jgi:hypothetical protein
MHSTLTSVIVPCVFWYIMSSLVGIHWNCVCCLTPSNDTFVDDTHWIVKKFLDCYRIWRFIRIVLLYYSAVSIVYCEALVMVDDLWIGHVLKWLWCNEGTFLVFGLSDWGRLWKPPLGFKPRTSLIHVQTITDLLIYPSLPYPWEPSTHMNLSIMHIACRSWGTLLFVSYWIALSVAQNWMVWCLVNKLKRLWKEVVVASLDMLSWHWLAGTVETHMRFSVRKAGVLTAVWTRHLLNTS